jgi:hypothetical protein
MVGSGAHGPPFVLPALSWYWCLVCHAVVVGWFFTSMSLMEGKGSSGVVDGLSTVRLHSHWNIQPFLKCSVL